MRIKFYTRAFLMLGIIGLLSFVLGTVRAAAPTPTPTVTTTTEPVTSAKLNKVYVAEVVEAEEIDELSTIDLSNIQAVLLEVDTNNGIVTVQTTLSFPSPQFKRALKIGDKVLLQSEGDLTPNSKSAIVGLYRQNNLLVWSFILIGLFMLVSGFRSNVKYFLIFIITIISGVLAILFYHQNTYLTFGSIFLWQIIATTAFAYRIFRKRTPSLLLAACVLGNEILAMGLVFVMKNINLFDISFFELFFSSNYDAREVMIYVFALLMLYPISVVFAEVIITEGIKKKSVEDSISRLHLIRHVSRYALKTLNIIFLALFGLFFAVYIGVVAIASRQDIVLVAVNNTTLSQILSVGFLMLFNLLIFVPLISFVAGVWLGKVESHRLITDKNHKHLEI